MSKINHLRDCKINSLNQSFNRFSLADVDPAISNNNQQQPHFNVHQNNNTNNNNSSNLTSNCHSVANSNGNGSSGSSSSLIPGADLMKQPQHQMGSKSGVERMLEFGRDLFQMSQRLEKDQGPNEANQKMLEVSS